MGRRPWFDLRDRISVRWASAVTGEGERMLSHRVKDTTVVEADIGPGKTVSEEGKLRSPMGGVDLPVGHELHVIVYVLVLIVVEVDRNNDHLVRRQTIIDLLAVVSLRFDGASNDASIVGKSDFFDPRGCNLSSTRP